MEAQIGPVEETVLERDAEIRSEIREARAAYDAGDYVTLEEYLEERGEPIG